MKVTPIGEEPQPAEPWRGAKEAEWEQKKEVKNVNYGFVTVQKSGWQHPGVFSSLLVVCACVRINSFFFSAFLLCIVFYTFVGG